MKIKKFFSYLYVVFFLSLIMLMIFLITIESLSRPTRPDWRTINTVYGTFLNREDFRYFFISILKTDQEVWAYHIFDELSTFAQLEYTRTDDGIFYLQLLDGENPNIIESFTVINRFLDIEVIINGNAYTFVRVYTVPITIILSEYGHILIDFP